MDAVAPHKNVNLQKVREKRRKKIGKLTKITITPFTNNSKIVIFLKGNSPQPILFSIPQTLHILQTPLKLYKHCASCYYKFLNTGARCSPCCPRRRKYLPFYYIWMFAISLVKEGSRLHHSVRTVPPISGSVTSVVQCGCPFNCITNSNQTTNIHVTRIHLHVLFILYHVCLLWKSTMWINSFQPCQF